MGTEELWGWHWGPMGMVLGSCGNGTGACGLGARGWGGLAPQELHPCGHWAQLTLPRALPASEPNLKVRCKPRKCQERRKNPLTRKESAPPSLKRRPPEAIGEGTPWWPPAPPACGHGPWHLHPAPQLLARGAVSPGLGTLSVPSPGEEGGDSGHRGARQGSCCSSTQAEPPGVGGVQELEVIGSGGGARGGCWRKGGL